jgi:parvulin-like peptidyl-prolyl isomerase
MTSQISRTLCVAVGLVLWTGAAALAANTGTNTPAPRNDILTELFGDEVIARGKGVEVKRSQLDSAMISIKATAAARGQAIPPAQLQMLEQQVLQRLIQIQLLLGKATEADRAKGRETATNRFAIILKRAGSEEALNRQLKSVGLTDTELRARMTDEAIAEAVLERELKVTVTDADVKKFYDENPARFEAPEQVRVSQIALNTFDPATRQPLPEEKQAAKRKQAEDLLKRARAGEDFAKLAREYSDDPRAKETGGELTLARGNPGVPPEFESAAFSLHTNQISDLVTTQFGFHIIKLLETIPAHKVELAKVSDEVKEGLKRRELEKLLPDYLARLERENHVEILDEKLKPPPEGAGDAAKDATEKAGDKK